MIHKKHLLATLLSLGLIWSCGNSGEQNSTSATGTKAEDLFASKCSMCHAFKEDKIGPALAGSLQRWGNDRVRLKAFITNSSLVIKGGDPYATALYEKWNKSDMPSFQGISEAELDALVDYIQ